MDIYWGSSPSIAQDGETQNFYNVDQSIGLLRLSSPTGSAKLAYQMMCELLIKMIDFVLEHTCENFWMLLGSALQRHMSHIRASM
jgi:hypothetical protein